MDVLSVIVWIIFGLAALPAVMAAWNLCLFLPLKQGPGDGGTVSVLIPARNEEEGIGPCIESVLGNCNVTLEVLVLDDQSTDRTAAVVSEIARRDARVQLVQGEPLPDGWCGKQWACWQLARRATHERLVWLDADVRLASDALVRMADRLDRSGDGLISGFPHQETGTLMERLVVPLIQVVLLGYLPMWAMRRFRSPGLGAGCGQLFMARREAYFSAGGHSAPGVRASMHDGVTLPRAFRKAGHGTDLFDATDLATCRMYRDAGGVWHGFAKNATEGMATPVGLPVWTLLLIGGHVAPWVMLLAWACGLLDSALPWQRVVLWGAWVMAAATSLGLMFRFRQPWTSGLLRPAGVVILIAIQWYAAIRKAAGRPAGWRGRAYA